MHVFRLMRVISRLGCGEGLRDCGYGGGWGGGVSSMLTTELSTYILGSKGMLLSARCKTEVGPRWSHMLPHSRVVIQPFSLVHSLELVREMGLSFSESRMSQVAGFRAISIFCVALSAITGCKDDSFFITGFA